MVTNESSPPPPFTPRYEALFHASDCLRAHQDLNKLLQALPFELRPVLGFDYMSLFLNGHLGNESAWYVLNDHDNSSLAMSREAPVEQAHIFWAFEHQQPAVVLDLRREPQSSCSTGSLSARGFKSGCAVPITTAHTRIGAMFFASQSLTSSSDDNLRFLSFVALRVALAVDGVLGRQLREHVAVPTMFTDIVGSSDVLNRVLTNVSRVAPTDATVLITGESGTGKELIAHAIHKRSNRSRRPFIAVNCAAIPPSLIASELFGYEKGAFTGAVQRHIGRFEAANGGTIFLDEIGEIPAETQIALLRVLQEREIVRIGGTHSIPVDVRVLAATNCDLRAAVNAGWFRLDLFYRLNVFPIHMPSLRERPEDILPIATHFIAQCSAKFGKSIRSMERRTVEWLQSYDWPGNIRELQNIIERAVILCDGPALAIDEAWLQSEMPRRSKAQRPLSETLVNQEKELIQTALEEARGRVSGPLGAALKLGMPRTTLESKIRSLQINKHAFKCSLNSAT